MKYGMGRESRPDVETDSDFAIVPIQGGAQDYPTEIGNLGVARLGVPDPG